MGRPDRYFDWHAVENEADGASPAGSRGRLRRLLAAIAVGAAAVWVRVAALECFYGADYRAAAARPIVRREPVPGVRGRLLARDGTVLAYDRQSAAVAVAYRYLEEPPNERWLERLARSRLPRAERRNPARLAEEVSRLLAERAELRPRLAALCGRPEAEIEAGAAEIQRRVSGISRQVNQRRQAEFQAVQPPPDELRDANETFFVGLGRALARVIRPADDRQAPAEVTVAEELAYHVLLDDVALAAVAEIESHPERYPGVRIVERRRRVYAHGPLAAHVLGCVEAESASPATTASRGSAGRMGVERQFDALLRGEPGWYVEQSNHSGRRLASFREREPSLGRDLVLTLDPALQRTAETLLDQALARRSPAARRAAPGGGAVVVIDVESGAILASTSAPRFDPNDFSNHAAAVRGLLADPAKPLFDRAVKMALPPGSVFKTLSAVALLESAVVEPGEAIDCQGYLHQSDRLRCQLFRRQGLGHGPTTLADALTRSCNVYFFHFAEQTGPAPLIEWAGRFGCGQPTGVDLPDEAAGQLPNPESLPARSGHAWGVRETQAFIIGQGALTVTPLQVVRWMAAIANGGRLVTPHVASHLGLTEAGSAATDDASLDASLAVAPPCEVEGLTGATLDVIREALLRVVADEEGTAHRSVTLDAVPIAGKTGTAETGGNAGDHAWFAGYAPADRPRLAFVVVLEHAGDGGEAAGPVAKRLVMKARQLGYFDRRTARSPR